MSNGKINMLPLDRQKALAQEYWIHFGTVVILTMVGLVVAAGTLLLPSYVLFDMDIGIKQKSLATTEHTLSSSDEKEILSRLKVFSEQATSLRLLGGAPSAVKTVTSILEVSHEEISLAGFVYVPAGGKAPRSVVISGVAGSRDALRSYQDALQDLSGVASADLPVSAYAKDTNIPFTISVVFLP
jgi:hypothetical protein